MVSPQGRFYAAYLDNGTLHYFSNDARYRRQLPRTIVQWLGQDKASVRVIWGQ